MCVCGVFFLGKTGLYARRERKREGSETKENDRGRKHSLELLLLLVDGVTTWAHTDEEEETTDDGQSLEKVVLEEVALEVVVSDRPKVIDEDVEDGEEEDEEHGRPLCLEANRDHDAGNETQERSQDTDERPFAVESGADKEEDEQNATRELEIRAAVAFRQLGQGSKHALLLGLRVGQDHDKATDNGQVTQEKGEVENKTVPQCLRDHDAQQTIDCIVSVSSCDHTSRRAKHHLE